MKKDLLFPLFIIVMIALGCSKITNLAKNSSEDAPANTSTNTQPSNGVEKPAPASGEFAPSSDAKGDIEKMAARFMSVKSFRATMNAESQPPISTELEFAAPESYRLKNSQGPEVIIIGRYTYMQIGSKWQKMELPAANSIGQIRTAFTNDGMKWISDVKYDGDETVDGKPAYVYSYHGKAMYNIGENDSKLWVGQSDGLPIKLETKYLSGNMKSMKIVYDYSTPVTIEPPTN